MNPRIVPEPEMPPDLDRRIRESLCACFPDDAGVFAQTRAWHGSAPAFSAVMEEEGAVVAHVGVVERAITVGSTPLRVGGVQNVFVLPAHRGRGLADVVLAAAMVEAERRGIDAGLLFCVPGLEKVYRRTGWLPLGEREVVRVEEGTELPLPGKNITMFYPMRVGVIPEGKIHLRGNDW